MQLIKLFGALLILLPGCVQDSDSGSETSIDATDYWWDFQPYVRCGGPNAGTGNLNAAQRLTQELQNTSFPSTLFASPMPACHGSSVPVLASNFKSFSGLSGPYEGGINNSGPLWQSPSVGNSAQVHCFSPTELQTYLDNLIVVIEAELPEHSNLTSVSVVAHEGDWQSGQHENYHTLHMTYDEWACGPMPM